MNKLFLQFFSWPLFALILTLSPKLWSEPEDLERRVTLSSGYIEGFFNSNEGLVNVPLSVMAGYSKLFDVALADNLSEPSSKRLLAVFLDVPFSYWLSGSLMVPWHEFGHARVMKATGQKYSFMTEAYGRRYRVSNYWALSAMRLITPPFFFPGTGSAATKGYIAIAQNKLDSTKPYEGLYATLLVMSAAGMNNQMFLAKKIGTTIYERNGHFTYLQHYINNKITGFYYASLDQAQDHSKDPDKKNSSDPSAIIHDYDKLGISINHGDLKTLSLVSLLSGTTLSLMRGYYDFVANNNLVVRPLEFYNIRVVDINGYINASGLSLELESDYRFSPHFTAGLAYEFVYKGKTNHNVTPRARYNLAHHWPHLNQLWLRGDIIFGKGMSGSLGADYAPFSFDNKNFWSRLGYGADFTLYNANNLYGERNIVSVRYFRSLAAELLLSLYMRY